ncbi:hypothetical protein LPJ64_006013 [Coemansia asiatica]|uniref:Uncharacterized protein n=1 Tax=Coemansia asiatica TaxID=1052880 RepID=A0A9W7XFX6_9FUNG|nr:hypothetical protein LPJ64_006013 [Coemansia asiatica]
MQVLKVLVAGQMWETTRLQSGSLTYQYAMDGEDETLLEEQMIVEQFMEECHNLVMDDEDCPLMDLLDTEEQTNEEYDETSSASSCEEAEGNMHQEMLMDQYINAFKEMIYGRRGGNCGLSKEYVTKLIGQLAAKRVLEIAEILEKQGVKSTL